MLQTYIGVKFIRKLSHGYNSIINSEVKANIGNFQVYSKPGGANPKSSPNRPQTTTHMCEYHTIAHEQRTYTAHSYVTVH